MYGVDLTKKTIQSKHERASPEQTLCDERLLNSLHISSRPVIFQMSTVSSTGSTIYGQEVNLQVQPLNCNDTVSMQNV